MKTGLYFGSFNPIHIGHLIIANHILNETALQEIWFVISPQNPFKVSSTLLNEYDRLFLVQRSIENDPRLKASDIEFSLSKPSYTSTTLAYLREKYPTREFSVVMGSDSFQNISKWHNYRAIVDHYPIIIYLRPGFPVENTVNASIHIMQAPMLDISATHIRTLLKEGKSIKYLVPEAAELEIIKSRFFKNQKK
ncbi:nicotinate (nicotinamide) nucleotide adenylyltransferase [Chitinophagaceae bacterium LB-8]|uniref:Probable nicotinate-nucleotide adenylyltransferase n=1 Tax=Paraflavisolibacter caeni TaxID=2982496 RepID=A0A9X2Y0P7_9BACT|nr:nicotinate (nicotinamide) nucleotide adenylyltransferase [Paraflavisolibacter caeni]MCU7550953.1 nicotinate (nicotinamide) nucleotide adenylyltransferase [Paraflavisolibacter caeni]